MLVVEDDADARSFVRGMSDAGAEVREASDVPSALSLMNPFGPHVLVSDVGMPREDGYDLIRRIRESGYAAEVLPAIALTAFARDEDRDRALAAGYQQHLPKPVSVTGCSRSPPISPKAPARCRPAPEHGWRQGRRRVGSASTSARSPSPR